MSSFTRHRYGLEHPSIGVQPNGRKPSKASENDSPKDREGVSNGIYWSRVGDCGTDTGPPFMLGESREVQVHEPDASRVSSEIRAEVMGKFSDVMGQRRKWTMDEEADTGHWVMDE